jgi:phosphate-selective porin OprO/OprP
MLHAAVSAVVSLATFGIAAAQPAPQAPAGARAAQVQEEDRPRGFRFVFNDRPSFRFGDVLRIDLRFRLQGDFRWFSPDPRTEDVFDLTRRRAAVSGTLFRHLEYEFERELRDRGPWRDVFVDFTRFDALQVKAGKFKIPFSLEEVTGSTQLDFIHRSLLATYLAPSRDIGVMVHGRLFDRFLAYEVGGFNQDGENARLTEPLFVLVGEAPTETGASAVARFIVRPFRFATRGPVRNLEIGVAATRSTVPEGLSSLRGRTVFRQPFFDRVYVNGRRLRLGAELNWTPGPVAVRAEYVQTRDERKGQGLRNEDLSDFVGEGWYMGGTWAITGEAKSDGIEPRRELFRGGFGAVELAARYEELRFGSAEKVGPAFSNPRAANLLENTDKVLTVGINWYLNRWVKLQINGIRERLEDPERVPILGEDEYRSAIVRLQFRM